MNRILSDKSLFGLTEDELCWSIYQQALAAIRERDAKIAELEGEIARQNADSLLRCSCEFPTAYFDPSIAPFVECGYHIGLRSQLTEARESLRDAQRYRLVRKWGMPSSQRSLYGEQLDAAIDAAIGLPQ